MNVTMQHRTHVHMIVEIQLVLMSVIAGMDT